MATAPSATGTACAHCPPSSSSTSRAKCAGSPSGMNTTTPTCARCWSRWLRNRSPAMAAIQTRNLGKTYKGGLRDKEDTVALDSLDLTVNEGEVFGFLGPNGAGKTTTINLLLNFMQPTT